MQKEFVNVQYCIFIWPRIKGKQKKYVHYTYCNDLKKTYKLLGHGYMFLNQLPNKL